MQERTWGVLLLAVGVAAVGLQGWGIGFVAAESGYAMDISPTTDVPDRTVEIEGDHYEITEIVQRDHGETLTVSVTAPDPEATYRVRLYDSDMNVVMSRSREGDATVTFDLGCADCDPGSYMLFLYDTTGSSEERVLAQPVVIAGYDVTLEMPTSAEEGETVTATVDVHDGALTDDPHAVEVAFGNGAGEERRVEATHESGPTYAAEVTIDVDPGTYLFYAGALSSETIGDSDDPEALAISGSNELEVTSSTDDTGDDGTESGGSAGGGGGGGGGGGATTSTPSETVTPTATDPLTPTSSTPTPTDEDAVTASPSTTDEDASSTPSATEGDVITPADTTTTDGDGSGLAIPAVLGVLSGVVLWVRRLAGG